jgi:hypothetical protein
MLMVLIFRLMEVYFRLDINWSMASYYETMDMVSDLFRSEQDFMFSTI